MILSQMNRQLIISIGLIQFEDRFLLTRRFNPEYPQWHQRWEFPGGKIQPQETPLEALHREVLEETNLTINTPQLLGVYTHDWKIENGIQQTFILVYHCFADQQHVQLKPEENDAYVWMDPNSILAMDNLLDGTIAILKEFWLQSRQLL
ncbi:MAG: NUDIX domain-containing protein [Parachlamydia sp.]|nr:NUDIX domain-containing protein [Parachlamydia sp.]